MAISPGRGKKGKSPSRTDRRAAYREGLSFLPGRPSISGERKGKREERTFSPTKNIDVSRVRGGEVSKPKRKKKEGRNARQGEKRGLFCQMKVKGGSFL